MFGKSREGRNSKKPEARKPKMDILKMSKSEKTCRTLAEKVKK
jgi:hypothetical protein